MKGSVLFRNRGAGSLHLGLGETEKGEVGGHHRQRSTWLGLDRILSDTLARGSPCQWLACPLSFVPQQGTPLFLISSILAIQNELPEEILSLLSRLRMANS